MDTGPGGGEGVPGAVGAMAAAAEDVVLGCGSVHAVKKRRK